MYIYGHLGNLLFVWLEFGETDVHQRMSWVQTELTVLPPSPSFPLPESSQLPQLPQRPAVLNRNEFPDYTPMGNLAAAAAGECLDAQLCLERVSRGRRGVTPPRTTPPG